jgi:(p)ppGpp synthase/HD superfamily hydrolase
MELVSEAIAFAVKAHDGMRRKKSDAPYILHPMEAAVIVGTMTDDQNLIAAAALHDVVEDSHFTLKELAYCGFSEEIVEAVDAITKRKEQSYEDYLVQVRANPLARKVKIADLVHNSDLSRLNVVKEEDLKRVKKYQEALIFLEAANGD